MNKPTSEFLNYLAYERNFSKATVSSYQHDIDSFFEFLFKEDIDMEDVDQIVIRNYLTNELNRGLSKRSLSRKLSALKHFYHFLYKHEYIKDDPFIFIHSPKQEKRFPKTLYKEQVREILKRHGATRLSEVNPDDWGAVLDEAAKLRHGS